MPIDPNIALGVKPIQFESPINQMAKVYEMQNAQQANQLNQMKMDEYQRGIANTERRNALFGSFTPDMTPDAQINALIKGGYLDEAKSLAESTAKVNADKRAGKSSELDAISKAHGIYKSTVSRIIGNPTLANAINTVRKTGMMLGEDVEDDVAELTALGENPDAIRQWASSLALEADKLLPKFENQQNVMVGGVPTTRVLSIDPVTGKARTVEGSAAPTYNKPAASTVVNVDNKQESEFNKQLGGGQAKKVLEDKGKAEEAAQILATNQVAKNLLDKGMLTGVGAEFFTTLNQGLSQAGIDFGKANAAQNSQAFGALMAKNTAAIIKNFGAGTGISDADRIYAKQAAAGDITMDENAIREIIKVNDRVARAAIAKHNKNVSGIQTNVPLTVDVRDYTAGIPEGRSSTSAAKKGAKTLDDIFK
jgi:hypothetical protein